MHAAKCVEVSEKNDRNDWATPKDEDFNKSQTKDCNIQPVLAMLKEVLCKINTFLTK